MKAVPRGRMRTNCGMPIAATAPPRAHVEHEWRVVACQALGARLDARRTQVQKDIDSALTGGVADVNRLTSRIAEPAVFAAFMHEAL